MAQWSQGSRPLQATVPLAWSRSSRISRFSLRIWRKAGNDGPAHRHTSLWSMDGAMPCRRGGSRLICFLSGLARRRQCPLTEPHWQTRTTTEGRAPPASQIAGLQEGSIPPGATWSEAGMLLDAWVRLDCQTGLLLGACDGHAASTRGSFRSQRLTVPDLPQRWCKSGSWRRQKRATPSPELQWIYKHRERQGYHIWTAAPGWRRQ